MAASDGSKLSTVLWKKCPMVIAGLGSKYASTYDTSLRVFEKDFIALKPTLC